MARAIALLVIATFSMMSASLATAQSLFFDDGDNGIGFNVGLSRNRDATGFGANIGYTVNARLDISIGFSSTSFDQPEFYNRDLSSQEFSPSLGYAVIRPSRTSNFGLEIRGSYTFVSFSGSALSAAGLEMSGDSYALGGEVYQKHETSDMLEIYPAIGVYYGRASATATDDAGNRDEQVVTDTLITARLSLLIDKQVYITPGFSAFDNINTFSLTVGLVFPTNTR